MEDQSPRVAISKIYVKDMSFESPAAPQIFRSEFQPQVSLDVQIEAKPIEQDTHEVVLNLTAEAKSGSGSIYFIVEIEQAGLFNIVAPDDRTRDQLLRVFCPSILFPYARQAIDNALHHGGFPPLMLAPINFEHMARATT